MTAVFILFTLFLFILNKFLGVWEDFIRIVRLNPVTSDLWQNFFIISISLKCLFFLNIKNLLFLFFNLLLYKFLLSFTQIITVNVHDNLKWIITFTWKHLSQYFFSMLHIFLLIIRNVFHQPILFSLVIEFKYSLLNQFCNSHFLHESHETYLLSNKQ